MKSPFKILDAYGRQDKEIFFGRQQDVELLYELIHQSNLLLVYGQSGTGKTSVIQCGLANRFLSTDWFDLYVRRQNNINESLLREISKAARTPIKPGIPLPKAIHSLFLDVLKPIYLIFDQFEELFILGSAEEQKIFIHSIAELLNTGGECKIIIVMREEYIASLYGFEKEVPSLFNKRFRVEPMSPDSAKQVIISTAAVPRFKIKLEKGEATAQQIIDNLMDPRGGVQLSYLQVYLDKLYRKAAEAQPGYVEGETPIVFTEQLVQQTGKLDDVLADFLEEQTAVIQEDLKTKFPTAPADAIRVILEEGATQEGTKQPILRAELLAKLQMPDPAIGHCLKALEDSRILRNIDEGVYELSHDSLAGRIAERMSLEKKNLRKVEKLIKDRQTSFEQTHTYLSKGELSFIDPYLEQLHLNQEESRFVKESTRRTKRKQQFIYAGAIAIMAVLVGLTIWALKKKDEAYVSAIEAKQKMDLADSLRGVADSLRLITERNTYEKFTTTNDASIEPETLPFGQLQQIMPNAPEPILKEFSAAFNKNLRILSEINTPKRLAAFLAQIAYESNELRYLEENLSYSASTLMRVFPQYFPNIGKARQYEKNPEKIANYVYAKKMGNGDEASGDGWKYRGRGILQINGKANYKRFQDTLGYDLLANPDQAGTMEVSTAMACQFWNRSGLNQLADAEQFEAITKRIAGGLRGYEERRKYFNRAKEVLRVVPVTPPDTTIPRPRTISGNVVDSINNPLSGVLVDGGGQARAITDSRGKFRIQIPSGSNSLRFSKTDYKALSRAFNEGDTTIGSVRLFKETPNPLPEPSTWPEIQNLNDLEYSYPPGATGRGTVVLNIAVKWNGVKGNITFVEQTSDAVLDNYAKEIASKATFKSSRDQSKRGIFTLTFTFVPNMEKTKPKGGNSHD